MATVRSHLWFGNDQAEEAARFYAKHIPGSSVDRVLIAPEGGPGTPGAPFVVEFTVAGHPVTGLNAGPDFQLTEAFSFYLLVDGQDEVDHYWDVLTADGGEPGQCGWLKDKYGLSWQIVPTVLLKMMQDKDPAKARRVTEAMMQMGKLDIAGLQRAYDGR